MHPRNDSVTPPLTTLTSILSLIHSFLPFNTFPHHITSHPSIHSLILSFFLSILSPVISHHITLYYITDIQVLRQLGDYVQPMKLREGDVIMHTTQGSPIDLDEDGLFFIESGCVVVQRDPDQSVALTLRSNRRRRLSVAPRMLRLKHRTFQLSRLGPVSYSFSD